MAKNTNCFDENNEIEDILYKEPITTNEILRTPVITEHLSFEAIASKLIKDNLLLTALELHTELVESGREILKLRDYFSNPSNFERTKLDSFTPALRKFYNGH